MPDGCVELVVPLGDPFRAFSEDGLSRAQPRAFVVGPSRRFILIQPGPRVATLGVRFRPAGARLLLPMPLHELAEHALPLDDLIGRAARPLLDALGNAPDDAARSRMLEADLLRRQATSRSPPAARAVVGLALQQRGQRRVADIGRELSLSPLQVERLALAELGPPAKAFCRLVRFQAVFAAVRRRATIDWAEVALDCGYADQAHEANEWCAGGGAGWSDTGGEWQPRREASLSTLSWMAGTWRGEEKGVSAEEVWTEPRGGMMLGGHRDVKDDRVVSWEFLRIEEQAEGIFYMASPKGAPATPFRLVENAAQRVVFSNPEHDFPKRVLYWQTPDGALHAAMDGGQGTRSVEWRRMRVR